MHTDGLPLLVHDIRSGAREPVRYRAVPMRLRTPSEPFHLAAVVSPGVVKPNFVRHGGSTRQSRDLTCPVTDGLGPRFGSTGAGTISSGHAACGHQRTWPGATARRPSPATTPSRWKLRESISSRPDATTLADGGTCALRRLHRDVGGTTAPDGGPIRRGPCRWNYIGR